MGQILVVEHCTDPYVRLPMNTKGIHAGLLCGWQPAIRKLCVQST